LGDGSPFLCESCSDSSARAISCSFQILNYPGRGSRLSHCRVADHIQLARNQCSRDNELTEQTGAVYLSNARYNVQTGIKLLETLPIHSCCAKTVFTDNGSVACSLVVDLADQMACGLNFKPFQSMLPELRSVARKHHQPA